MTPEIEDLVQKALADTLHSYLVTRGTIQPHFMDMLAEAVARHLERPMEDMVHRTLRQYMSDSERQRMDVQRMYQARNPDPRMAPPQWRDDKFRF